MKAKMLTIACLTMAIGIIGARTSYGAFQIRTKPQGAKVTLLDNRRFVIETPSHSIPLSSDRYMTYYNGVPGKFIDIVITKKGYLPVKEKIFVPINRRWEKAALKNPTVFRFDLTRQVRVPWDTDHFPGWAENDDFDWNDWSYAGWYGPNPPQGPGSGYNQGDDPCDHPGGHGNDEGNHGGHGYDPPDGGNHSHYPRP
jgi:hypothetical protein